jgi:hypothetical protein
MTKKTGKEIEIRRIDRRDYTGLLTGVSELLEQARHAAARSVNQILTATYWEIGRRIVDFEQQGARRAEYGVNLLQRLAKDLSVRFGRGFGYSNLNLFRQFYLTYHDRRPILQSVTGESLAEAASHRRAVCFLSPQGWRPVLQPRGRFSLRSLRRRFTLRSLGVVGSGQHGGV